MSYIRNSNSSDIEINQIEDVLSEDDLNMEIYIKSFYGEDCVLNDCRRLEHDNDVFHPFILNSVKSTISSTETCGNSTCYNISTVANVTQYPVMFPEVRSHLIVVSKVLDFMEDREIVITPLVPVPQEVSTEISITFTGVQNNELDDENEVAFTETVLDFLADILGLFEPPILIEDVQFNSQTLTVNVIATEAVGSSSDNRRLESSHNETENEYAITINVTVTGRYLPPPDIDFDSIVVEVFDEEGQEDFITAIDENNIDYFEPVVTQISVSVETVEKEIVESKKKSKGLFGSLGDEGGIALTISPLVFIIIILILLGWRKNIRHKHASNMREMEEDLERFWFRRGRNYDDLINIS